MKTDNYTDELGVTVITVRLDRGWRKAMALAVLFLGLLIPGWLIAAVVPVDGLTIFMDGEPILADEVNGNFEVLRQSVDSVRSATIINEGAASVDFQDGVWVNDVTRINAGHVSVAFEMGVFAQKPTCVCTSEHYTGVAHMMCNIRNTSPMGVEVLTADNNGTQRDREIYLICIERTAP